MMILCCLFGCTACFDLQENLFLKKDGSGNFSFTIDMSEFKSMMAMFDQAGDEKGEFTIKKTPQGKLNTTFEITRRKLLNTKGVSNVKAIEDTINYVFGLSFDFKDIETLNKAMNRLFEADSVKTDQKEKVYFQWKDKQLTRLDVLDSKSLFGKTAAISDKNGSTDGMFNINKLFESVSYSTNYEFENKVGATINQNAMLSSNFKRVSLKCYPFAVQTDSAAKKCSIANTITLK